MVWQNSLLYTNGPGPAIGVRATLPGQTPHETSLYMRRHAFWHISDQVIADTAEMQPDWRGDAKDIA